MSLTGFYARQVMGSLCICIIMLERGLILVYMGFLWLTLDVYALLPDCFL